MEKYITSAAQFIFSLVISTCLLGGCSATKQEKAQEEAPSYQRIVSLNGAVSEILHEFGQTDNVVATDITSNYPESIRQKPKVGHNRNISIEGILAQQPDVILGIEGECSSETVAQLKSAGSKFIAFSHEHSAQGVAALAQAISDSLSLAINAAELTTHIDSCLQQVQPFQQKPKVLFIYARGAGTLLVAGTGTPVESVIQLAGGSNAVAAFDGFKPFTAEAAIEADPDIILMFKSGLSSLESSGGVLELPGIAQTKAADNQAIISMEGQLLAGFGPRLGEAVLTLNKKMHEVEENTTVAVQ